MCFGCPNHASYKAMTSGEFPAALCCRRGTVTEPGPEHPWGAKRYKKNAKLTSLNMLNRLEACGTHRGWTQPRPNVPQSSQIAIFRIGLSAIGCSRCA